MITTTAPTHPKPWEGKEDGGSCEKLTPLSREGVLQSGKMSLAFLEESKLKAAAPRGQC